MRPIVGDAVLREAAVRVTASDGHVSGTWTVVAVDGRTLRG